MTTRTDPELVIGEHDIAFTEFVRPNGRRVPTKITRPPLVVAQARAVMAAGYRFECEVLATEMISMTVEPTASWADPEPIAHEICPNGAAVLAAVDRLVATAYAHICERGAA